MNKEELKLCLLTQLNEKNNPLRCLITNNETILKCSEYLMSFSIRKNARNEQFDVVITEFEDKDSYNLIQGIDVSSANLLVYESHLFEVISFQPEFIDFMIMEKRVINESYCYEYKVNKYLFKYRLCTENILKNNPSPKYKQQYNAIESELSNKQGVVYHRYHLNEIDLQKFKSIHWDNRMGVENAMDYEKMFDMFVPLGSNENMFFTLLQIADKTKEMIFSRSRW